MKELTKRLATLGIKNLSPAQAKSIWDLSELSPLEAQQATGIFKNCGAIEIGYGHKLPSRFRWIQDGPVTKDTIRYHQPKDSGVLVYIPKPLRTILTPSTHLNPYQSKTLPYIVITEGEFKAIAAVNKSIPCIALSGVWSFMTASQSDNVLHPVLNKLPKIPIYICFDYDPVHSLSHLSARDPSGPKAEVKLAEDMLIAQLLIRGYDVKIIRLATTSDPSLVKIGLDDFLLSDPSGKAWQRKLDTALKPELHGLAYMISRYIVLGTSLWDTTKNMRLKVSDFKTFTAHIRPKRQAKPLAADDEKKETPLAVQFLSSKHKVRAIGFSMDPGHPPGLTPAYRINTWGGYRTKPVPLNEGIEPFLSFKSLIFSSEPHLEAWWDRFVAMLFQRPQVKQTILPILTSSAQGVGKSTLAETIAAVMNGTYKGGVSMTDDGMFTMPALVLDTKALEGKFNSVLNGVKLLVVNEMGLTLERGSEQRLKDLMTSPTLRIEAKGFDAVLVNNIIQVIGTSNEVITHRMKADSRRELIISIPEYTPQCDDLQALMRSKQLHTWLYCDAQKTGGPLSPLSLQRLSAIHHYYSVYPLDWFDGTEDAPRSEGKTVMSDFSANDSTNKLSDFIDEYFKEYDYVMPIILQHKYNALFPNNPLSGVSVKRAMMELGWTYPAGPAQRTPHQYVFPKGYIYPPALKAKQIIMRRHPTILTEDMRESEHKTIHKDIIRMYNDQRLRQFYKQFED